jgi:hypothetical protein
VPAVTVEVVLSSSFDHMSGAMVEVGNIGGAGELSPLIALVDADPNLIKALSTHFVRAAGPRVVFMQQTCTLVTFYLSRLLVLTFTNAFRVTTTGSYRADDCNTSASTSTSHTAWGQSAVGGVTVFGTPERVIYGGCGAGIDFDFYGYTIAPQNVPTTRRIRFEIHQSSFGEVVELPLGA